MIEALVGAAVGALTIVVARAIRGQRWLYALGLPVLPALYASFALRVGEWSVGAREMLYGIPFVVAGLLFVFVSVPRSAVVVGGFWILHGLFDLAHNQLIANPGAPGWYPVWCCAVDVVVGAYLLYFSRRIAHGNLRAA